MTPEQGPSLALLVLTTFALGSFTTMTTVAAPKVTPGSASVASKVETAPQSDQKGEAGSTKTASVTETIPADPGQKVLLNGRIVSLHDALQRKKIKSYAEEAKGQYVLETEAGELLPIIADGRGRALYQDERLRNRRVTLLAIRRTQIPHLQVVSIYTYDEAGNPQLTDYWCDICAIPMYEIKKCECCQGPTRLRFQKKELPKLEKIAN